jgi:uncharacterized OsmC-like protein
VNEFVWTARVRADEEQTVTVHARNLAFRIGEPLSFRPSDSHASALEHLIAALAADLIGTFRSAARRRRIPLDNIEMSINATLHDPLGYVGVVGEQGDPSLKAVDGVLYVSSDASPEALQAVWADTLSRSPIYRTLSRAAILVIRLKITV